MMFSGKVYDILKWIVQIVLPAFGTAYFGLAPLWHLPNLNEVLGTTAIVATFLGVSLGISTKNYNKNEKYVGDINVTTNAEGTKTYSLEVEGDLDELDQKSEVTFKVNKA